VELYGSELEKGRLWSRDFQVVIGSRVASLLELDSGDKFYSTHGFLNEDDFAHEDSPPFIVSGILKQSGTVIDQLILTSPGSVWAVHEHSEDASGSEHESHEETGQVDLSGLLEHEEKDITSILLQYKSKTNFQSLNLMRNINENTNLQAASPAMEMNRLYSMIGVGTDAMRIIAIVIAIVSALSVFISLFNTVRDRKYELALMRVMGGSRQKLFLLVILEGLLISLVGTLVGFVLGHMGMSFLSGYLQESYGYHFSGFQFQIQEVFILVVALALGILAALFPARQASRTDIQKILTDN
jgi:putative ABC transport system permease protein